MTIENEAELRDAYESIAKMYRLSERIAQDAIGDPETTEDICDGIHAMMRKIERQIVEYVAKNPQHLEPPIKVA
jgi:hypothetical protein